MRKFGRLVFLVLFSGLVVFGYLQFWIFAQDIREAPIALFPIEENDRWGYIDRLGKVVIAPGFAAAGEFSEGRAAVEIDGRWGFINTSGELVIEPKYSGTGEFSEGLARVQVGGDKYRLYGKWGFIDRSG
jgi:hypothetical protein